MADDALNKLLEACEFAMATPKLDDELLDAVHKALIVVANQGAASAKVGEGRVMGALVELLTRNFERIVRRAESEAITVSAALRQAEVQTGLTRFLVGVYCTGKVVTMRQAQEADADE